MSKTDDLERRVEKLELTLQDLERTFKERVIAIVAEFARSRVGSRVLGGRR